MSRNLSVQIADRLEADFIETGSMAPGDRLPSVRCLRDLYNTSTTTVVQALSLLQARGLVEKQHGRGCFISTEPRGSALSRIEAVGLVLPGDLATGCLADVYAGVEAGCRSHGCEVLLATAAYNLLSERAHVSRLLAAGVEGVILFPVTRSRDDLYDDYLAREYGDAAIVLIDNAYPEQGRSCVLFDNVRAGYEMTQWLLAEGHRRIAFVDVVRDDGERVMHRSTRDRHQGYVRALLEAGIVPLEEDCIPGRIISAGPTGPLEALLDQWSTDPYAPSAVIAQDDMNAVDLIHAARAHGLAVPQNLRVVGFDNRRVGWAVRPPFPTTDPDFVRGGETAVELLFRTLRGEQKGTISYLLDAPLVRTEGLAAAADAVPCMVQEG